MDIFAVSTSTFVLRQEKLSCLTPLSVLTSDVVKVKSLANFKRLEKGLLSSNRKKKFLKVDISSGKIHLQNCLEFWHLDSKWKKNQRLCFSLYSKLSNYSRQNFSDVKRKKYWLFQMICLCLVTFISRVWSAVFSQNEYQNNWFLMPFDLFG